MRCALYARYSSDRQNERSIEDQHAVCRRHAEARGWSVTATFSDAAISGAAMANRPGLQAMLAAAGARAFDAVLVEDEDRLARNLEHQAHIYNRLRAQGVAIATLASEKIGILEVGLKGVMAELYLVNLGQKTRRGMRANAEAGLATGARLYGYRSQPGGAVAIVPAEAAVIREAFARYAAGETARDIAATLNRRAVPSPTGGLWNASTLSGSRQRANGVLRSEIYAGVKVWNRLEVTKDPDTGKRLSRPRPESEWKRTPVPQLAIVTPQLWAAAEARRAVDAKLRLSDHGNARKPGVFSGLLKCGGCGASYTAYTGGRLICAGNRERGDGACANRRTVARAEVERRVLDGLATRLLSPEAVAEYVRAYHEAWNEKAAARASRRRPIEQRIAELKRRCRRIAEATAEGRASRADREQLFEHEAEEDRLAAELADLDAGAGPPIALHPRAADRYADLVARLQAHLAEASADPTSPAAREEIAALRALVLRIDITPQTQDRGGPFDVTIVGDLALFLEPVEDPRCMSPLVAGASSKRGHTSMPVTIAA